MTRVAAGWIADYRRLLKGPELEEPCDVWLYRPVAYGIVKLLAPTRIIPDQVTVFNLLPGLASAACFWQGTPAACQAGAGLLLATNVLDCVDGMLARVRGAGSATGHILDGLTDYVIQTAVFVALLHGVAARDGEIWRTLAYGVPAGLVYAWWCARVDLLRSEWLARVHGRRRDPRGELEALQREAEQWRREGRRPFDRLLVAAYGVYLRLWQRGEAAPRTATGGASPESWRERMRPVLRLAVLMGPSTHVTLIAAAGFLGHPEYYLWTGLVVGVTWGLLVSAVQAARERTTRSRVA